MTKKCKFEVEVTYNSDYFAEGEIRDTIKKAIKDLNDQKEKKFGRLKLCDPGKTNHGLTCNVKTEISIAKWNPFLDCQKCPNDPLQNGRL